MLEEETLTEDDDDDDGDDDNHAWDCPSKLVAPLSLQINVIWVFDFFREL